MERGWFLSVCVCLGEFMTAAGDGKVFMVRHYLLLKDRESF
jgi:hypothetical protein